MPIEPAAAGRMYAFALPRKAMLRRFRISGGGFDVASELRSRQEARKEYEDGIAPGSLSSLATIYRDGMTNPSVGPPLRSRLHIIANARVIESEPGLGEMELPD